MKAGAMFVIESDPRRSARPAEALRIAAGVGAWKKIEVAVYLRGPAILALGEDAESLMDGDCYGRYWPVLRESAPTVYVQKEAPELKQLGQAALPYEEVSDAQLAALAAGRACVLRF